MVVIYEIEERSIIYLNLILLMGHVAGICLSQVSYYMDISSSLVGRGKLDTRMRGMLFPSGSRTNIW